MTAIASQRMTGMMLPKRTLRAAVAADQIIRKGALCGFLGGYLYAWDAIEGLAHPCIAILDTLQTEVDNTGGADGDVTADVDFLVEKMLYPFANDTVAPLTQAHIGGTAYGLDDQTVTADGTGGSAVGTPWIISTGGGTSLRAGVYVELAPGSLAALAASAYAFAAAAPAMQAVNATLVAGTVTIAAGITVAANSEVIPLQIGAITGSTNFGSLRELKASRVNGAPGVGTVVIQAVGNDGALDVDAAGAIRVVILTPQV
jgi:hypothetical protein